MKVVLIDEDQFYALWTKLFPSQRNPSPMWPASSLIIPWKNVIFVMKDHFHLAGGDPNITDTQLMGATMKDAVNMLIGDV